MSNSIAVPSSSLPAPLLRPALLGTLIIGMTIAALLPFDVNLEAITGDSALLRVLLTAALVLVGAACGQAAGLRLEGHGTRRPALLGVAVAAGFAGYVVLLDAFLFRAVVPAAYVDLFHQPLVERGPYFMLRAFNENIVYRLFVFSGLLYLATRLYRGRAVPLAVVALCMVATQCLNIGPNIIAGVDHPSFAVLSYNALRYVAPGVFSAFIYRRNGFAVAEIASVGCHVIIQPALGWLL